MRLFLLWYFGVESARHRVTHQGILIRSFDFKLVARKVGFVGSVCLILGCVAAALALAWIAADFSLPGVFKVFHCSDLSNR